MTLSIDTILENRYRIDRLIGQGGMGAVYQGYDTKLKSAIAIKENFLQTPQSIRQFQNEAMILARLRHPNLPRVVDHFDYEGQQYLVMDFIAGEDLWQIVKQANHPLEETAAIGYIVQICKATQYLHEQEPPIIHRDIKPQNIKVTPKGEAILVDFGIAKIASEGALTTTGARGVTPGFSPYEQYTGEGTTPRSDVYSLGATLYALLTGQKPPDSVSLLANKAQFIPLKELNPKLSSQVAQAIRHAMQPLEQDRPASVVAWQRELENITAADLLDDQPTMLSRASRGEQAVGTPPELATVLVQENQARPEALVKAADLSSGGWNVWWLWVVASGARAITWPIVGSGRSSTIGKVTQDRLGVRLNSDEQFIFDTLMDASVGQEVDLVQWVTMLVGTKDLGAATMAESLVKIKQTDAATLAQIKQVIGPELAPYQRALFNTMLEVALKGRVSYGFTLTEFLVSLYRRFKLGIWGK